MKKMFQARLKIEFLLLFTGSGLVLGNISVKALKGAGISQKEFMLVNNVAENYCRLKENIRIRNSPRKKNSWQTAWN